MLEIDVVIDEAYDETTLEFVPNRTVKVRLEHSLVTVSKWESIWEEAFLGRKDKTTEQTLSYVKLMLVDEIPPEVFQKLIEKHLEEVQKYVAAPMTATKLYTDPKAPGSREVITAELIYYWMITMEIPIQLENWHLNRLITLIRVINLKNTPKKRMTLNERRALNRSRLSQKNTRG